MPTCRINFGAVIPALLFALACDPSSSTPRTAEASASTPAQNANDTSAPDPEVTAGDRGRIAGDSAARTWVIIASDFQCPYCRQWHSETYRAFVNEYVRTGKVKVAYVNYPLAQHANAIITAQSAMCAGAQNRFWEYHSGLFDTQARWAKLRQPRPLLDSLARSVGVDMNRWNRCVDSGRMVPLILADRDRAAAGGVESTPTFLIGTEMIRGAQRIEALRPLIDAAIAKNSAPPQR